jgi:hypothetical protein
MDQADEFLNHAIDLSVEDDVPAGTRNARLTRRWRGQPPAGAAETPMSTVAPQSSAAVVTLTLEELRGDRKRGFSPRSGRDRATDSSRGIDNQ